MQDVNASLMESKIEEAAGEVNQILQYHGINPDVITSTGATSNDFAWLGATVSYGAAYFYVANTAGSSSAMEGMFDEWIRRLGLLRDNPQRLVSYPRNTGSINSARGSATSNFSLHGDTVGASEVASRRILTPNRTNWLL